MLGRLFVFISCFLLFTSCHTLDPLLQCRACEALAAEFVSRLKTVDADPDQSFQVSHRLGATGKGVAKKSYRSSELRIIEITDDICKQMKKYEIAQQGWRRFFSKNREKTRTVYNADDREFIKQGPRILEWWCSETILNYEDPLNELLSNFVYEEGDNKQSDEKFANLLCNNTIPVCLEDNLKTHQQAAEKRHAKYMTEYAAKLAAKVANNGTTNNETTNKEASSEERKPSSGVLHGKQQREERKTSSKKVSADAAKIHAELHAEQANVSLLKRVLSNALSYGLVLVAVVWVAVKYAPRRTQPKKAE